jgi:hypothetical protein
MLGATSRPYRRPKISSQRNYKFCGVAVLPRRLWCKSSGREDIARYVRFLGTLLRSEPDSAIP